MDTAGSQRKQAQKQAGESEGFSEQGGLQASDIARLEERLYLLLSAVQSQNGAFCVSLVSFIIYFVLI